MSASLPVGKVPPALLRACLALCPTSAPDVLLGPSTGEDAAVIRTAEALASVTVDPITFATDRLGWYAVHVAANDIATRGHEPRWLLLTLLMPPGTTEDDCLTVFRQTGEACSGLGVALIGGHTEVTPSVTRPVVSATMIGSTAGDAFLTTGGVHLGDQVLLTGGCGIEGTAILARQFGARLRAAGVDDATLARAVAYLDDPGIDVTRVARAARSAAGVHAMHDPTEGGVACALGELALASGFALSVDPDALLVREETRAVCAPLGIDPHGLIASGALLVACSPDATEAVARAIRASGACCSVVARATSGPPALRRADTGKELPWSHRDELARALDSLTTGEEA